VFIIFELIYVCFFLLFSFSYAVCCVCRELDGRGRCFVTVVFVMSEIYRTVYMNANDK